MATPLTTPQQLYPYEGAYVESLAYDGLAGSYTVVSGAAGEVITLMGFSVSSPSNTGVCLWQSNATQITHTVPVLSGTTTTVAPPYGLAATTRGENLNLCIGSTACNVVFWFVVQKG